MDTTYSLRVVVKFLEANNIPFVYNSARVGILFYEHGCRVQLNDTFHMSIQTHPDVAGNCFAETAMQNMVTKQIVDDVERFYTPEDLFEYVLAQRAQKAEKAAGKICSENA